jgi:hypothetical protein
MLEVIDKRSCSESHPVPWLVVHGANHAAWCWDEHVLDFFADKGYRALAVSPGPWTQPDIEAATQVFGRRLC